MDFVLQIALNGLQAGAVYVLFAVGLTLIFGVMKIVNFAHGELYTGAAFTTFAVVTWGHTNTDLPTWALYIGALIASVVVMGTLGWLMYELVFKRFTGDLISGLLVAVGLSLALQTTYRFLFGSSPKRVPSLVSGGVTVLGASITYERLTILVLAVVTTAVLAWYLKRSRLGIALRAVSEDHEAAQLQGINYRRMSGSGFVLGAVLASIAAVLIAPATVTHPSIGVDLLMKGFIIIILGGLGNVVGAIYAGFLLGLVESTAATLIDVSFATILSFVAVIIVLIFRPKGLLGDADSS